MNEGANSVSIRIPDSARLSRDERFVESKRELLQRMFGEQLAKELPLDGTPVMVRALREEEEKPWDRTTIVSIKYELRQTQTMNYVRYEMPELDFRVSVQDSIGPFLQAITREVNQLADDIKQNAADRDRSNKLRARIDEYKTFIAKATEQLHSAIEMADVAAGAAAAIDDDKIFGELP